MGNCFKKNQQLKLEQTTNTTLSKLVQPIEEKGLSIVIKCWKETRNSLFNYNLPDSQLSNQIINVMLKKVRIVKLGQQYQALLPNDPQFSKVIPPVMIDVNQVREKDKFGSKRYTFQINEFPKISKPFWLVVKSLPNQRYNLKQGDIFKMGKVKLRVKQIILKNSTTIEMNKEIVQAQYKIYDCDGVQCQGVQFREDIRCRVCMQPGQNSNPLIGLCECIGSSKYSHFKCLRQWFTTQLDPIKINQVTEINWKALQCQVCLCRLPYSIKLDNQIYYLVKFPKIKKPYIVLNPVYKNNNQKSKIYYFISFKKRNRMIIGRNNTADIQLSTDATISRHHTIIQYIQNNIQQHFYLQDNNSKFGTVVLLHTKYSFYIDTKFNGITFQVGGDLIKIKYKTQNFLQNLIANEDQIDFNQNQSNFMKFAEDQDDNKIQQQSEQNERKYTNKQYDHRNVSPFSQDHSTSHQQLFKSNFSKKNFGKETINK